MTRARHATTTTPSRASPTFDLPWDELQRLNILADQRPRRVPAADLHRDDHRPADGVLRDHRAPRRHAASARATSRRCSRRSSATRTAAATCDHGDAWQADARRPRARPARRHRRHPGLPARASRPTAAMAEHGLGDGDQAGLQRVAVRPAARRRRGGRRGDRVESTATPTTRRSLSPSATPSIVGVDRDRVAVGAGSVGLLAAAHAVVRRAGRRGRVPVAELHRLPAVHAPRRRRCRSTVPLRRQAFDVDALRRRDHRRARDSCCIANPNNPTGTARAHRRPAARSSTPCRRTASSCSTRRTTSSSPAPTCPTRSSSFGDHPNVVVLRTLSKAYGLAGLRVGFLVADPDVVDAVNATLDAVRRERGRPRPRRWPRSSSGDEVARRCAVRLAERTRVAQELRRRGLGVPDSQANFWWLPAGAAARDAGRRARAARRRHPSARRRRAGHRRHARRERSVPRRARRRRATSSISPRPGTAPTGDARGRRRPAGSTGSTPPWNGSATTCDRPRRPHRAGPGEDETWDAGRCGRTSPSSATTGSISSTRSSATPVDDDPVPFGRTDATPAASRRSRPDATPIRRRTSTRSSARPIASPRCSPG